MVHASTPPLDLDNPVITSTASWAGGPTARFITRRATSRNASTRGARHRSAGLLHCARGGFVGARASAGRAKCLAASVPWQRPGARECSHIDNARARTAKLLGARPVLAPSHHQTLRERQRDRCVAFPALLVTPMTPCIAFGPGSVLKSAGDGASVNNHSLSYYRHALLLAIHPLWGFGVCLVVW